MATVLVVDDEPQVLKFAATVLEQSGYGVLRATGGVQGLMLYFSYADQVDLVLTDVVMPEMTGAELAFRILAADPSAKIVLMSGFVPDGIELPSGCPLVAKPFELSSLMTTLERVLAG